MAHAVRVGAAFTAQDITSRHESQNSLFWQTASAEDRLTPVFGMNQKSLGISRRIPISRFSECGFLADGSDFQFSIFLFLVAWAMRLPCRIVKTCLGLYARNPQ